MKIAFVITQSLDSPGGLGRFGPIARELVKIGYEAEIIALHPAFDTLDETEFISDGVLVKYVAQMHVYKAGSQKQYFSPTQLIVIAIKAILALTMALWRSDAEIIQLGKAQPFNILAAVLAKRHRPIFCDCDDYEAETNVFSTTWQKQIVRFFENNVRHIASGLTVNTHFIAEHFRQLGYPGERIEFVPNGVERSRFQGNGTADNSKTLLIDAGIQLNNPIILYVGSLGLTSHPIDLLLMAFQLVLTDIPNAQLVLAGGGEDYEKLRQMAINLDIAHQTFFLGRVDSSHVPNLMRAAEITVDPVRDDLVGRSRCPLKIVESLAVGVPVVTSDVGDRRHLLNNGQCGVIAPKDDELSLANAMIAVLNSAILRQQMGEQAVIFAEDFYWDKLIHNFSKIYKYSDSKEMGEN